MVDLNQLPTENIRNGDKGIFYAGISGPRSNCRSKGRLLGSGPADNPRARPNVVVGPRADFASYNCFSLVARSVKRSGPAHPAGRAERRRISPGALRCGLLDPGVLSFSRKSTRSQFQSGCLAHEVDAGSGPLDLEAPSQSCGTIHSASPAENRFAHPCFSVRECASYLSHVGYAAT
jgi:hypothetical protein